MKVSDEARRKLVEFLDMVADENDIEDEDQILDLEDEIIDLLDQR